VQGFVGVIATTGAGDAFLGGFAYALASSGGLSASLVMANACGALSVTRPGTQTSLPDRKSVDAIIEGAGVDALAALGRPRQ